MQSKIAVCLKIYWWRDINPIQTNTPIFLLQDLQVIMAFTVSTQAPLIPSNTSTVDTWYCPYKSSGDCISYEQQKAKNLLQEN